MAFLDKTKLKKKAEAVSIAEHPLLKKRNLSDAEKTAYLQGCVLATLVDDAQVSEEERNRVRAVGLSLRFSESEIDEAFSIVSGLATENEKQRLVDEIVSLLKEEPTRDYFIKDFESVIHAGGGMEGDAADIFDAIGARLYEDENWQANRARAKAREDADRLMKALEKALVETMEDDMIWPVTYDKESILALVRRHGVKEHQIGTLLSLLLPYARAAYDGVRKSIGQMDHYVNRDRHYLSMTENENALRFLNYVKCRNDCAALNPGYAVIRPDHVLVEELLDLARCSDGETMRETSEFYWVSLETVNYSHRRGGADQEARKGLLRLYKSILDEFENIATF